MHRMMLTSSWGAVFQDGTLRIQAVRFGQILRDWSLRVIMEFLDYHRATLQWL